MKITRSSEAAEVKENKNENKGKKVSAGTPKKGEKEDAAEHSKEMEVDSDGLIVEDVASNLPGKKGLVRGKAWRTPEGEYVKYLCTDDGTEYKLGDSVYLESQRADQPFFICSILEFRRSKRDTLMVNIKWFYRPSEVPETVYQLLVQDRNTENKDGTSCLLADPVIKGRELFSSDATDNYSVSVLRGVCRIHHFADAKDVKDYTVGPNSFYCILGYNPETRRLASTQGEIRVGPSHQARLPELHEGVPPALMAECCEDREDPGWRPDMIKDGDLLMYLRAARSMAAFAGMCDGGSPDDGCLAASRDDTTINALDVLHFNAYDPGRALQALVKCPVPKGIEKKWTEEETKRFVKGLRQFGKNFFRIRRELLPHKETGELVEFYYLWKKTPGAVSSRPHRRHRRQSVLRRIRSPRTTRNNKDDPGDLSSASEDDNSDDDSDSRDLSGYHCRHCFTTTSKDWHHAGKDKALLCTECRVHYKKYGEMPPVKGDPPPRPPPEFMFRPVVDDGRVRTRTRSKELNARGRLRRGGSRTNSPSCEVEERERRSGRKSPSTASNCSSSSSSERSKKKGKFESPSKKRKRGKAEVETETEDDKNTGKKKLIKNESRSESPSESITTESGSVDGDNSKEDENEVETEGEGDGEGTSSRASSPERSEDQTQSEEVSEEQDRASPTPPAAPIKEETERTEETTQVKSEDSESEDGAVDVDSKPAISIPEQSVAAPVFLPPPPPLVHTSIAEAVVSNIVIPRTQAVLNRIPPTVLSTASDNDSPVGLVVPSRTPQTTSVAVATTSPSVIQIAEPERILIKQEVLSPRDGPSETPVIFRGEQLRIPTYPPPVSTQAVSVPVPVSVTSNPGPVIPATAPVVSLPPAPTVTTTTAVLAATPTISIPSPMVTIQGPCVANIKKEPQEEAIAIVSEKRAKSPSPVAQTTQQTASTSTTLTASNMGSIPHTGQPTTTHPYTTMLPYPHGGPHQFPAYGYPHFYPPYSFAPRAIMTPTPYPSTPTTTAATAAATLLKPHSPVVPEAKPLPLDVKPIITTAPVSVATSTTSAVDSMVCQPHRPPETIIIKQEPQSSQPLGLSAFSLATTRSSYPIITNSSGSPAALSPHAHSSSRTRSPNIPTSAAISVPIIVPSSPYPLMTQPVGRSSSSPHSTIRSTSSPHSTIRSTSSPHSTIRSTSSPHTAIRSTSSPHSAIRSTASPHSAIRSTSSPHSTMRSVSSPQFLCTTSISTPLVTTPYPAHGALSMHHLQSSQHRVTTTVPSLPQHPVPHHAPAPSHHPIVTPSYRLAVPPSRPPPHLITSPVISTTSSSMPLTTTHHSMAHGPTASHIMSVATASPIITTTSPAHPPSGAVPLISTTASQVTSSLAVRPMNSLLPPTAQPLPPTAPSYRDIKTEPITVPDSDVIEEPVEEVDTPSPPSQISRGPSPEAKIEDNEFHRSSSAIFLRHWYRGEGNSCARTDLTFKPVPESKLAKKREDKIRRQQEKEREERDRERARKAAPTPEKRDTPKSSGPIETISSPYADRLPRAGYPDTPALRQLSDFARPHTGLSPGIARSTPGSLGIPPHSIDPMLHFQMNAPLYGDRNPSLYSERARLNMELEREKHEREMREMREREERLKVELSAHGAHHHQSWMEMARRLGSIPPGIHVPGSLPTTTTPGHFPLLYPPADRMGIPTSLSESFSSPAERLHAALTIDPMIRLQLAGMNPEFHAHAHTHAHAHAHAHTHLHLHTAGQDMPGGGGINPGGLGRPILPPGREPGLPLHPTPGLLHRPYDEQLAQHLSTQEQLQRQMLMERERFSAPAPPGSLHHPQILQQQHDELLLRRDRELKVRVLEDAARSARP